jgi:hypothetical protein
MYVNIFDKVETLKHVYFITSKRYTFKASRSPVSERSTHQYSELTYKKRGLESAPIEKGCAFEFPRD